MNFDLINIIDKIEVSSFYLNDEEIFQFIENTLMLMNNFIEENPKLITEEDFLDIFQENINDIIFLQFENDLSYELNADAEYDIEFLLDYCYEIFFDTFYPKRQDDDECFEEIDKTILELKIEKIKKSYQPEQRSNEWYTFRHNLITASNAYKCFENTKVINQLIYEKCCPINIIEKNTNINSPLHWGQKYEKISVMLYEDKYKTKVGDFGCIKHSDYNFLGASPDGINIDKNSPYFGIMLEIKNPISRIINGIPKKEYWVQCQLQLECCDLEYCHFLETSFEEYETKEDFDNDGNFLFNVDGKRKGIIVSFSTKSGIHYVYKPLYLSENQFDEWLEKNIDENSDKTFFNLIYWKLNVFSCVLIKRNRIWFKNNIDEISKSWDIILEERENLEYEKRAPTKKLKNNLDILSNQDSYQNIIIDETNMSKNKKNERNINECFLKISNENKVNLIDNIKLNKKEKEKEKIIIKII